MRSSEKKRKIIVWSLLASVLIGAECVGQTETVAEENNATAVIQGSVRSPDGTALYGILVSAKGAGRIDTTYVFTDEHGRYEFPPLPLREYEMAVGTARMATVQLAASGANQDFDEVQLGPDLVNQANGPGWLNAVPGSEEVKKKVAYACVACHSAGILFTNSPSTPAGWAPIVNLMINDRAHNADWWPRDPDSPVYEHYLAAYSPENAKEITEFLVENATPETKNLYAARALLRPTGEAARAVYTEWQFRADRGGVRDAWTDEETGMIWYIMSNNTIGKLDPRTGEFQQWEYEWPALGHFHDMWLDARGDPWITASRIDKIVKFDSRSYEFTTWDVPSELGHYPHTGGFDQSGNYWFTLMAGEDAGVAMLDPRTGEFTKFDAPTKWSYSYDVWVDREREDVWFSQLHANKIGKVEIGTGTLTEYSVPTPFALPRRLEMDSRGRMWFVASGYPGQISMLDPETGQFSEYQFGVPNGYPYWPAVDRRDKIWFNSVEGNMLVKFDPDTEEFVRFLLPVPETYSRAAGHIDYSIEPYGVLYPSANRPGVLGRMQVREERVSSRP